MSLNPKRLNKEIFADYQRKEKENTIKLYKLTISLFLIINTIFIIFFILYKTQLYTLQSEIQTTNSTLLNIKAQNHQTQLKTSQRLVNIFANIGVNKHLILDSFKNVNEFTTVLSWANLKKENLFLCFKSNYDHDDPYLFRRYCDGHELLILIIAENGKRFGGFVSNVVVTDLNKVQYADENAFLFSLDNLKKFKVNDKEKAFYLQPNGFFSFGENDLVINGGFKQGKVNTANFPNNYGNREDTLLEFTGGLSKFDIIEMEILQSGSRD